MGGLIVYGIIAAAVVGAFGVYHHSITLEGERIGIEKQLKVDKPLIEACQANLKQMTEQEQAREAELAKLRDSAARQSAAIDAIAKRTADSIAQTNSVIASQKQTEATFQAERQRLNVLAITANDKAMTCEQRLAKIEPLVDDALRRLRNQSGTAPGR